MVEGENIEGRAARASNWDWEQRRLWNGMQPLPFPFSTSFRPKYLIDSPQGKFILFRCAFKGAF
jgi:hypothetical protein